MTLNLIGGNKVMAAVMLSLYPLSLATAIRTVTGTVPIPKIQPARRRRSGAAWGYVALLFAFCLPSFAGTITGQLQTSTGGIITNGSLGFKLSQPAVISGTASIVTNQAFCYTSTVGNIVGLPDPLVLPIVTTNTASGTLAAGTYYTKITYYGAGGETVASPETVTVLTAQGMLIITPPALQPVSATGYKVYIGSSSGAETLQSTIVGFTQYQQSVPLAAGSALPSSNTTVCTVAFSDQLIPTGTYYVVSFTSKTGANISGFPQTWCTFGGQSGTINVSNGAPTGNCGTNGVFYPVPIFANPFNNSPQSISGPMTFTAAVTFSGSPITFTQGINAPFFASQTGGVALSGILRLAEPDTICWRNHANSSDLCISKNASDQFVFPIPANLPGLNITGPFTLTSSLTATNAGVFTNTAGENGISSFSLNSCSGSTEWTGIGQVGANTSGLYGCVAVPNTSTAHQASGISGYANGLSTSTNTVGGYFSGRALASSVHAWGGNSIVSDMGFTNTVLVGHEVDVNTSASATTPAIGLELSGTQNSPGNTGGVAVPGRVGFSVFGGSWNNGFTCNTGNINTTAGWTNGGSCFFAPPSAGGNTQNSHAMSFVSTTSGGTHPISTFVEDPNGVMNAQGSPFRVTGSTGTTFTFSQLPSCTASEEGAMAPVSDDATAVAWGSTVTGGGANHVLAYCDGTNWTIAAK